jgi:uncharacterized protein
MKKILIKKTSKKGEGIFAGEDIKKGEYIFTVKGEIIKKKIKNQLDSNKFLGLRCLGIDKNTWIDPYKTSPLYYMNHSCSPNAGIKGKKRFYAIRNINRGEEIVFDYSISEEDIFWRLKEECQCKSKNCRKIIKSIQFLPKKTFNRYLPFIGTYFKKIYLNHFKNKN